MQIEDYLRSQGLEPVSKEDAAENLEEGTQETEQQAVDTSEDVVSAEGKTEENTEDTGNTGESVQNFEDSFKEKYESFEALESKIRSLEESKKGESLSDRYGEENVSRLEKLLDGGLSWDKVSEIAKIQSLNVDSLDDRQALVKSLELKDGLSAAEIKGQLLKYDRLKDADLDLMDEEEQVAHFALEAEMKRLAKSGKEYLNSLKGDEAYSLPTLEKPEAVNQEEVLKQRQQEFEELGRMYEAGVSESLKDFNSIKINLGEGNDYEFELNEEQKQVIQDKMNKVNSFHENFNGDGKILFNEMASSFVAQEFLGEIVKSAVENNTNNGKVEAIKDINNVVDKSKKQATSTSGNNYMSEIEAGYKRAQGI